jgi:hypothetical protein
MWSSCALTHIFKLHQIFIAREIQLSSSAFFHVFFLKHSSHYFEGGIFETLMSIWPTQKSSRGIKCSFELELIIWNFWLLWLWNFFGIFHSTSSPLTVVAENNINFISKRARKAFFTLSLIVYPRGSNFHLLCRSFRNEIYETLNTHLS